MGLLWITILNNNLLAGEDVQLHRPSAYVHLAGLPRLQSCSLSTRAYPPLAPHQDLQLQARHHCQHYGMQRWGGPHLNRCGYEPQEDVIQLEVPSMKSRKPLKGAQSCFLMNIKFRQFHSMSSSYVYNLYTLLVYLTPRRSGATSFITPIYTHHLSQGHNKLLSLCG